MRRPIEVLLGLWFATIMNRQFRGRALVRAAILIPWAIPTAVTAKLWYFIFAYDGIATRLLGAIGIHPLLWAGDAWPARSAIIIADVWKTAPFMALLILAGLQLIPADVYEAAEIDGVSFALPLTVYTLTAFLSKMPWDLEEAARIDGCTPGQAFRKIMLPLAAPGLFSTAILAFIGSWNEFLLASQFSTAKTQPVTVAIANFAGSQPHQEPYTAVMAAGTIVTIPLIIVVLIFQRRIISGLTAGGVKG